MMEIQKKALNHVRDKLKDVTIHRAYSEINNAMKENGVDDSIRRKTLDKYTDAIDGEMAKVRESLKWIESMLRDI